ncbi:PREDICTED: uncharacterized protein LOC107168841 [Diuraphis noxia]|uniref:uncharacterized protein LOC107168841 n=1 Tax=Diuraphis noxia TaxID=143948 RepID=UPI0007637928|nr:PREDICTED: uncharacterized protein LOC107168841 [Diuraphis noxia]
MVSYKLNVKLLPSFVSRLATSNATLNTRNLSSLRQAEYGFSTGKVSCRSLILRRLDEDGFVMMTDGRSRKSKDLVI